MKNTFLANLALGFSFLFLGTACNQSHISTTSVGQPQAGLESLMNGVDADMTSFEARAVVQILDRRRGTSCTGTMIDQNIILTAAHCAMSPAQDLKIFFEVLNGIPRTVRQVNAVIVNDKYNRAEANGKFQFSQERGDIALLHFEGHAPAGYLPVSIPQRTDQWLTAQDFLALGFGLTGIKKDVPGRLRNKNLKAKMILANQSEFTVDQRASGGVCPGDSGGPAMVTRLGKLMVIGVASAIAFPRSATENDELCQFDAVYTNVAFYRDWIDQKIQLLNK